MHFDTVIRNGTIVTATDTFRADLGIRDGRIAAIADRLMDATEIIDATGLLVMPGGIDSHVHLSQPAGPGIVPADDFLTGSRSAAIGGNTTIMPFCLQQKGQSLRAALAAYRAEAEGRCFIDYAIHLIVTNPTPQVLGQELPALIEEGYRSLKIFMTYDDLKISDREMLEVLSVAKRHDTLVMVHAEGHDVIKFLADRLEAEGRTGTLSHALSRPVAAEREATHRAISFAEVIDTPIMIVHVSNRESMEEIRRAQQKGLRIFGETCPQYLVLTKDHLRSDGMEGAKYVCSPPPRDTESQQACWDGLAQGVFEVFPPIIAPSASTTPAAS